MFAATSLRKAVLNAAASSRVSGGTSRVLVFPGSEAFAITAMPQDGDSSVHAIVGMPLGSQPFFVNARCAPAFQYAARTRQVTTTMLIWDHIPAGSRMTPVHATVITGRLTPRGARGRAAVRSRPACPSG